MNQNEKLTEATMTRIRATVPDYRAPLETLTRHERSIEVSPLTTWVCLLSILTSITVIFGSFCATILHTERQPRLQLLPIQSPTPTRAPRKAGASLVELIDAAAGLCGVPPAIAHRLVARESSGRQWDRWGRTLRSSSGALGLTQIKPNSAREISPTLDIHTQWGNLLAGLCYLSKHRRGDSWRVALHRYRLGPYHKITTQAAQDYAVDILGSAQ